MRRQSYDRWRPYVPVAERGRQAARKIAKMRGAGHQVTPIEIAGRKIAETFWGDAWCSNLEAYSDYSNRLPRGRTYVRNGSVIDLQIEAGRVRALVSGSYIYEVDIRIEPIGKERWTDIKRRCAGRIDSLVELLKGSISKGVMEIVSRKGEGLFPSPGEISLHCSCPDWATMCKHVAAALYGVGARLDHAPELLFTLRGVDPVEMVEAAGAPLPTERTSRSGRVLDSGELSAVFGVDIEVRETPTEKTSTTAGRPRRVAKTGSKAASGTNGKTGAKPSGKKPSAKKPPAKKPPAKKPSAKKPGRKAGGEKATKPRAATRKTAPGKNESAAKPVAKRARKRAGS